jgi:hypothetical protein
MPEEPSPQPAPEIVAFYGNGLEEHRLTEGTYRLEFIRTCMILQRFLPSPPAGILDIGGGPGAYARWLTAKARLKPGRFSLTVQHHPRPRSLWWRLCAECSNCQARLDLV